MKSRDTLVRLKRFQVEEKRRRLTQIEMMIAEFNRMARELDREIAARGTEVRRHGRVPLRLSDLCPRRPHAPRQSGPFGRRTEGPARRGPRPVRPGQRRARQGARCWKRATRPPVLGDMTRDVQRHCGSARRAAPDPDRRPGSRPRRTAHPAGFPCAAVSDPSRRLLASGHRPAIMRLARQRPVAKGSVS